MVCIFEKTKPGLVKLNKVRLFPKRRTDVFTNLAFKDKSVDCRHSLKKYTELVIQLSVSNLKNIYNYFQTMFLRF